MSPTRSRTFVVEGNEDYDFVLCEIGGTVGDIEGLPFFEAIRQLGNELPRGDAIYMHLTLMPYIPSAGELKTKPTQHSVKELRSIGIQPDILMVRCDREIPPKTNDANSRCSAMCAKNSVIRRWTCRTSMMCRWPIMRKAWTMKSWRPSASRARRRRSGRWKRFRQRVINTDGEVTIAVVGKYTDLKDAYKSLIEALTHGGIANRVKVNIEWIEVGDLRARRPKPYLEGVHGILVPGGFGERGAEGKIAAVTFRAHPQGAVFRHLLRHADGGARRRAQSGRHCGRDVESEFGAAKEPVVGLMTEWMKGNELETRARSGDLGGTMRLGAYDAKLEEGSRVAAIYGATRFPSATGTATRSTCAIASSWKRRG
jgi:CTP synthase